MSEKLYYTKPYTKEFTAKVLSCEKDGNFYKTVLDRTAFFPEGGGQKSDTGFINNAKVSDVRIEGGTIFHFTDKPLCGDVLGKINFEEKFEKMQCHSAEHIVSGIAVKLFGVTNVGFNLGDELVTVDYDKPLSDSDLEKLESLSNNAIYENRKINCFFPDENQLKTLNYRCKKELKEDIRLVEIDGTDLCACCAPHLRSTGEIGIIKFIDRMSHRGGTRIFMEAGNRAFKYLKIIFEQNKSISAMLSAKPLETSDSVKKIIAGNSTLKNKLSKLDEEFGRAECEKIDYSEESIIIVNNSLEDKGLIRLFNGGLNKTGKIFCVLQGEDGNFRYILGSRNIDVKNRIKEINSALNGRGGGKDSSMIRGTFCSSLSEIKKFLTDFNKQ